MPFPSFVSRLIVQLLNRSLAVAYARGRAQPPTRSGDTSVPERGLLALDPRFHRLAPLPRDARAAGARARRVRPPSRGRGERRRAAERAGRATAPFPELDGGDRRRARAARAARAQASRSRPPHPEPAPDRRREE